MANPQIEDGYTKIANELLEAISKVNLSSYEFRIMMAIIRKTYGFSKKEDYISLSQLGELTGIKSNNVCRTLKKLKAKNMIVTNGHCQGIQKDYDNWTIQLDTIHTDTIHLDSTIQTDTIQTDKKVIQIDNKTIQTDRYKRNYTKETIQKKVYCEFVFLTDEEYQKLINLLGDIKTQIMIDKLNNYIGSKGKKYKSHYYTILNWVKMEEEKNVTSEPKTLYKKVL